MIYEDIFSKELTVFIANLNLSQSISLISTYPEPLNPDIHNQIIQNIFYNCEIVFGGKAYEEYSHTFLTIPFKIYESLARVLIDTKKNATTGEKNVFITVIFMSDNLPQEMLNNFDNSLDLLAKSYIIDPNSVNVQEKYSLFIQTYDQLMQMQDLEISIDQNYTLISAVEDFKKGIKFYQEKKWKTAYPFLKRAYLKFQVENQEKLILETLYLIGNVLVQLKKYNAALENFDELEKYALNLNHQKYIELSNFMQGFCNFKEHKFNQALIEFNKIQPVMAKFINRSHYYAFKGRAHFHLHQYSEAIESLNLAKAQLNKKSENKTILQQKAKIEYDLGLNFHQYLIQRVQKFGLKSLQDPYVFEYNLKTSIHHFLSAVKIWEKIGNIYQIMETYQLIGNIYGYLNKPKKQIQHYRLALDKAKLLNDFHTRIRLILHIIQLYDQLKQYNTKIDLLKRTLNDFDQYIFIDNSSRAYFHFEIGRSHIMLNEYEKAYYELITAENIYKKLNPPAKEEISCMEEILNLQIITENTPKIAYYEDQLEKIKKKFHYEPMEKVRFQNHIKDFWIITISGLEIFSYNPNVRLDPTLFGGFITALQCFSREISQEELDSFVIGDSRYIFYYEENKDFYILARVNLNKNESFIETILKKIYKRFFHEYKEYLTPFYGETHPFLAFTKIIQSFDLNLL